MSNYGRLNFGSPPPGLPQGSLEGALHSHASMNPPDFRQVYGQGIVPFDMSIPQPGVPVDPNVAVQTRNYVQNFTFSSLTPQIAAVQVDVPLIVYRRTGAAYVTGGNWIPQSFGNSLDMFTIQTQHSTGDYLDVAPALGSALVGTAQRPAWLEGPAWRWDRGGSIRTTITPLVATLYVSIVWGCLELRGVNYAAGRA